MSELMRVTSPRDAGVQTPLSAMFNAWQDARTRTLLARHGVGDFPLDAVDYLTELALGTRLANEITAGRWCAVAELLRAGTGWAAIAEALGMSVEQARDGFAWWLSGQVDVYRQTGHGMTPAEADSLTALAEGVAR